MIADRSMLWSILTGLILLTADAQESDGPVIISPRNSEITLEYRQNYTLYCEGKRPVTFKQQELSEEDTNTEGEFKVKQTNGTSKNGSEYWAALELYNVDRYAVRYYACFDYTAINSTDLLHDIVEEPNNNENVSYVYVYVNDPGWLFASMKSFVVAKSDSNFVVECKPTTPDVKVKLTLDSAEIKYDRYSYYNPKVGFVIDSEEIPDSSPVIFKCGFDRHGKINSEVVVGVHKILIAASIEPRVDGGDRYFLEGETFTINCTVDYQIPISLEWDIPIAADKQKILYKNNSKNSLQTGQVLYQNITVYKASKDEAGDYICTSVNHHVKKHKLFHKEYLEYPVIEVSRRGERKLTKLANLVQMVIAIDKAYPPPNVTVFKDNAPLLIDGKKYKINNSFSNLFKLKIYNLSSEDNAVYDFKFFNEYVEKHIDIIIEVKEAPRLTIGLGTTKKYLRGLNAYLQCEAIGFPLPDFEWIFFDENGRNMTLTQGPQINIENTEKATYKVASTLSLPVNISGNLTCIARNEKGTTTDSVRFLVYDIDNGFGIENGDGIWCAEGENITLKCLASIYDFDSVTWIGGDFIELPNVKVRQDKFSFVAELIIDSISVAQAGNYYCMGIRRDNGSEEISNISVTVARTQSPRIWGPLEESLTVDEYKTVNLSCVANAIPPPKIEWYKDDVPLVFNGKIKNITKQLNRTLINSTVEIGFMQVDYAGRYECKVTSRDNVQIKTYEVLVNDQETPKKTLLYLSISGVIFFLLILLVVYLIWKIRKEKQFRRKLAAAGLLYFKEGVTKSINPDLGIDEQAELLPYDERFEFPPEKLKLGKQLGAGAFGVVYKAEARGIINAEETTTVAVKMVKKTADDMYIKALASELKIMVHLGKHINIVNLLGACTKKVGKRELIVIVEYCKFGNIHNYLQKHREVFIDQLNDSNEKTLGKVNRGYSCSSGNSAAESDYFGSNHTQQTDNTFINTANTNRSGRKDKPNLKETETKPVDLATVSESGYVQPEWRSNYESDYIYDGRSPRTLCSRDLLAWAFQIARGMEYLASRKILHGDLAARNILLAEDGVVKICDFGLARSIYKNDEYQKKENSPLPVKWLAIECMTDRIFTTQSDVWSFGIVLWEIFSLAKTPYPNISPQNLLQWLSEGHRLEKPRYSDDKLYDVMRRCWLLKPTARPSFTQLQEILGSFLEDNVRNHYVDLNATYMDMNVKQEGEEDYLAMVTAPDYNNLVTPSPHQYVNDDARSFFPPTPTQLQHDDEGYLQMSPASKQTLFTPRTQGTKFDFDAKKLSPRVSDANSYGSESTPMLTLNNLPRSGSESDQEGNASPYMNMCPKIVEETDDDVFGTKENNTKNVQPISVTNPTYITLSIDDEKKPQKFPNSYINVSVPNGLVK